MPAIIAGSIDGVDLEERTLETIDDRCQECGAQLTREELEAVLESGGPSLCKVHAAEEVPLAEEEASFEEGT
jgi:hypothetical protein